MVTISRAKKLAKKNGTPVVIPFPEACPITRLRSPSGIVFNQLRQTDVEVLMRLGWTYVMDGSDATS